MNQAGKQMQSMAENAMKAGADFMQNFMGGANGFDASKAFSSFDPTKMMAEFNPSKMFSGFDLKPHDKAMAYGQESAEQLQKTAGAATRAVNEAVELSHLGRHSEAVEVIDRAPKRGNRAWTVTGNIRMQAGIIPGCQLCLAGDVRPVMMAVGREVNPPLNGTVTAEMG
jgi:hypothetical protein